MAEYQAVNKQRDSSPAPSSNKSTSWVKDFKLFAESTTAHGVSQIFCGSNKAIRFFYLLAWIACVIYTMYMIITSIVTFINKPTGTKYEVIVEAVDPDGMKPQSIKFPTISICSHNKVKKSYLELDENKGVRHLWEILDTYDVTKTRQLKWDIEEMYNIQNMTLEDIIERGGPANSRLLMCTQRQKNCAQLELLHGESYFKREATPSGYCWRINPDGLIIGKSGDWGKMQLMLFADLKDYSERSADLPQYGYTVAFHDSKYYGVTLNSGYYMSPGSIYKVDLALKSEVREPPPGGSCNASLINTTYGAYSEGSCIQECKDRWLFERCGCVHMTPPINSENYKPCTVKQWANCGLEAYKNFSSLYANPTLDYNICPCSSPCKESHYSAQLSSSALSPVYTQKLLSDKNIQGFLGTLSNEKLNIKYNSSEDILQNVVVIEILFSSMVTSEIKQVVTYTSANLLGDIGGVLGLFCGASVFTIVEFLQLFLSSLQKHCLGDCGKKKKERSDAVEMSECK